MSDYRINAGSLRHRVTIERPLFGMPGAMGDLAQEWAAVAKLVPAEVEWLQGRKLLAAQAVHPEATVRIILRYNPSLTPQCRLIDDEGNDHRIVSLMPDTLKRHWTVLCKCVPRKQG